MKKRLLIVFAAFAFFAGLQAAPVMPTVGAYYMIQSARKSALAWQDNGSATQISQSSISGVDSQWWKLVEDGTGKYYLESKLGNRMYYNTTAQRFWTLSVGVKDVYSLIATANTTYTDRWEFQRFGSTLGVNENAGSNLCEYPMGDGGNPVNFLDPHQALTIIIASAEVIYATSPIGKSPGHYSEVAVVAYGKALETAKLINQNSTSTVDEKMTVIKTLSVAYTNLMASRLSIQVSTDVNEKWYFLKGQRGPTSTSLWETAKSDFSSIEHKTLNASDAQLWKVVVNGSKFAIQNKLTGAYLNADVARVKNIDLVSQRPVNELSILPSQYWPGAFLISSTNFNVHVGGATGNWALQNYNGQSDNCSLKFLDPFDVIATAISEVQPFYDTAIVGSRPGQYPKVSYDLFGKAIANAVAYRDNAAATSDQVLHATSLLYLELEVFKSSLNVIKLSDNSSTTWYTIKNEKTKNSYLLDKGLDASAGIGFVANTVDYMFKVITNGDSVSIVSRKSNAFIAAPLNNWDSKTPAMITKTPMKQDISLIPNSDKFYIQSNVNSSPRRFYVFSTQGTILSNVTLSGADSEVAFIFEEYPLRAQTISFNALENKKVGDAPFFLNAVATSTLPVTFSSSNPAVATVDGSVVTIHAEGYTDITANQGGDNIYNTAPSVTRRLTVSKVTGLEITSNNISILVKNRKIEVLGTVEPVRIFSVSGIQIHSNAILQNGIYVVKVAGQQFKVVVR